MDYQKIFKSSFVRRLPLLFIAVLLAGLALIVILVPLARADTTIYVRPGGDDTRCNGTANLDYSPAVAPNCAVKTIQRASSLAGSVGTIIYTAGSFSTSIPVNNGIGAAQTAMSISKSDSPDPVDVGDSLIYTIVVTNIGATSATQVAVVDSLPPAVVSYVDGTATASNGGTCTLDTLSFNITCDLGALDVDESVVITIPVTPTAAGIIENLAIVKSPDLGGLQPDFKETTLFSGTTDLSISKSDSPDPVPVGNLLVYTIIVTNSGPHAAAVVTVTDNLPTNTTFVSATPSQGTNPCPESGGVVTCNLGLLGVGDSATITIVVIPNVEGVITNTATVTSSGFDDDTSDNEDDETTNVITASTNVYLPIILNSFPDVPPPPPPSQLSYVSDVAADLDTNQIFIASPRHNWVYAINGISDTVTHKVDVGVGPTGLTVLSTTALVDNKVFVAHQYGANFWQPGVKAFGVNKSNSHNTSHTGYVGAAPIKIASNGTNNSRVYVSNYFDRLAVLDGASGPPENRLGWVEKKTFQGAYGIDASSNTDFVYLAPRDTGELVVFDGKNDRLILEADYTPTHFPPPQACSLWSVAVNEATGHVFVPCPERSKVFVLEEGGLSILSLEALGVWEERNGHLTLVVYPAAAPWIAGIDVPGGTNLGEEGIAVDPNTGHVFITNASNDTLVILQDGGMPSYVTTVSVGDYPQGVDVNPNTQKVYVGNAGDNSVTVLDAIFPFSLTTTIPLTP